MIWRLRRCWMAIFWKGECSRKTVQHKKKKNLWPSEWVRTERRQTMRVSADDRSWRFACRISVPVAQRVNVLWSGLLSVNHYLLLERYHNVQNKMLPAFCLKWNRLPKRSNRDRNNNNNPHPHPEQLSIDQVFCCKELHCFLILSFVHNDWRDWLHTTSTSIQARSCCMQRLFNIGHRSCVLALPKKQEKRGRGEPLGPAITLDGVSTSSPAQRH